MRKIKYTPEYIKNLLYQKFGFEYVVGEFKGYASKIVCKDKENYYYFCVLPKIIHHGHVPKRIHPTNPYTLHNINVFLKKYTHGEYVCISNKYISEKGELEFKHISCGRIIKSCWMCIRKEKFEKDDISINRTSLHCSHCDAKKLESIHALILKQVWLHEHSDSVVEDKSCINPNTNRPLPTDIVNHRLKIAIEIQSAFHENETQKIKDHIKRDFWINKGYDFYAIDHRNYGVLEMIRLFFPNINKLPDYIDYNYSNKFDDIKAQKLLNKYKSPTKVAEIMNCPASRIYGIITNKRLQYPDGYINNCYRPVVQLDLKLNYMATYENMSIAEREANVFGISWVLRNKRNYCGGYYWVYEDKYKSNLFTIRVTRIRKHRMV